MANLRFAMFGAGFWASYQLAGWIEAGGVECVALYNRTVPKAEKLAKEFGVPTVYGDAEELFSKEKLDFVDICTNIETHSLFTHMAARRGLPVVCQKPMATSLEEAESMVAVCKAAGVPFLINENWRWQYPIRQFKRILTEGRIGRLFRARIHYCNSFPVFDNQPFLKDLEQFILTDIGSHILDTARYLFGDAKTLYCHTCRVHPDIRGEDVATVMMTMGEGVTVVCEMSYASRTSMERFPETFIFAEGEKGSLELWPDYWIRETTEVGTVSKRFKPPRYPWADPDYDPVHGSIAPCQANLVRHLKGEGIAETNGDDNIRTVRLVFGSYESANTGKVLHFD